MDPKFFPPFTGWLRTLGEDVLSVANLLEAAPVPAPAEATAAAQADDGATPAGDDQYLGEDHFDEARDTSDRVRTFDASRVEPHDVPDETTADVAAASPPTNPLHRASAESLTYLLRTADLIPDGIEDLGYLEVAFAFRAIARRALDDVRDSGDAAPEGPVARLAADADLVGEFLEEDLGLFYPFVFTPGATRPGPTAADLIADADARAAALEAARRWVERYEAPELTETHEELIKIRSFFRTRVRRGE